MNAGAQESVDPAPLDTASANKLHLIPATRDSENVDAVQVGEWPAVGRKPIQDRR